MHDLVLIETVGVLGLKRNLDLSNLETKWQPKMRDMEILLLIAAHLNFPN